MTSRRRPALVTLLALILLSGALPASASASAEPKPAWL